MVAKAKPKTTAKPAEEPEAPKLSPEEEEERFQNEQLRLYDLAQATLRMEMGRGLERKELLGDDYDAVMAIVRRIRTGDQNGTREA